MEETVFASYSRSPVREAIFSVTFQPPLAMERVRAFCASPWAAQGYAPAEVEGEAKEEQPGPLGYLLRTADRSALLRLTATQLHYHQLGNYPGWEVASAAFLNAWMQLGKELPEVTGQEASIRYINKIGWEVPQEGAVTLNDYLTLLPNIPGGFPGVPGPFFLQVQALDSAQGLHATVTEVMEFPAGVHSRIEVVLDIEVSSAPEVTAATFDLVDFLQTGRAFKNKVFESCITSATRALFV
jgi:uncharacterized protein (TIGR04255 family)